MTGDVSLRSDTCILIKTRLLVRFKIHASNTAKEISGRPLNENKCFLIEYKLCWILCWHFYCDEWAPNLISGLAPNERHWTRRGRATHHMHRCYHRLRRCFVACAAPNPYLNQWRPVVNRNYQQYPQSLLIKLGTINLCPGQGTEPASSGNGKLWQSAEY